jgi:hypothetical protein
MKELSLELKQEHKKIKTWKLEKNKYLSFLFIRTKNLHYWQEPRSGYFN